MRAKRNKTGVLLAIAAPLLAGGFAVHASAGTGGVRAKPPTRTANKPQRTANRQQVALGKATVASWYGPGLYGNRTACGQILRPHVIGVAHRTLACGTLVRLTYRDRVLVAPVIDRGPYAQGVTWDLTEGAADMLGLAGTGKVSALVLGRASSKQDSSARRASLDASKNGGSLAN
jgi:rare lipoprotein A (peptidoglycan hydrolase)